MIDLLSKNIETHIDVITKLRPQVAHISAIAKIVAQGAIQNKTIFWMGNGGSAADSQHLAAELIGRFQIERRAIRSIALTTDSSILTCLSNDYSYDLVFSRQIEALCQPGDIVIGISTSGNSKNVCAAIKKANDIGAITVAFTGEKPSELLKVASYCIQAPSNNTARIQEAHILIGHTICEYVEHLVFKSIEKLTNTVEA